MPGSIYQARHCILHEVVIIPPGGRAAADPVDTVNGKLLNPLVFRVGQSVNCPQDLIGGRGPFGCLGFHYLWLALHRSS
jgi:hypothetical protein